MTLSSREKKLILYGLLILGIVFLADQMIIPGISAQFGLSSRSRNLKKINRELLASEDEIKRYRIRIKTTNIPLEKRINRLVDHLQLQNVQIKSDTTNKERVTLVIEESTLDALATIIYQMENSLPVIGVERMNITPSFSKKGYLRISLLLAGR